MRRIAVDIVLMLLVSAELYVIAELRKDIVRIHSVERNALVLASLKREIAISHEAREGVRTKPSVIETPPLSTGGGSYRISPLEKKRQSTYRELTKSPEYKQLKEALAHQARSIAYRPFITSEGLSTDKAEKFLEIVDRIDNLGIDINAAIDNTVGKNGQPIRDDIAQAARELRSTATKEIEGDLTAVLGTDGARRYNAFQSNSAIEGTFSQLKQVLSLDFQTVNRDQEAKLYAVLSDSLTKEGAEVSRPIAVPMPNGETASLLRDSVAVSFVAPGKQIVLPSGEVVGGIVISDSVVKAASTFLSGNQLSALESIRASRSAGRDLAKQFGY